jgi:Uma2 family endonuclease
MATSALQTTGVEQPVSDYAAGEGFSVIQGGTQAELAREDLYKQNVIPVEPRYEVIDGVVYMMAASPGLRHQRIFSRMYGQLERQLAPHGCEVIQAPMDVYLFWEKGDQKNFVEPDLFIACDQDQIKHMEEDEHVRYHGAPKFIVEILSPNSTKHDLVRKAELYYRAGVTEYWAVDPIGQTVNIFTMPEHGAKYQIEILEAKGSVPLVSFPGITVDFSAILGDESSEESLKGRFYL